MPKDKRLGNLALANATDVAQVAIYSNSYQKKQKIILLFADVIRKGILSDKDVPQLALELNSFAFIWDIDSLGGKTIEIIFSSAYTWDGNYNGQKIYQIVGDYIRGFVDARNSKQQTSQQVSNTPKFVKDDIILLDNKVVQFKEIEFDVAYLWKFVKGKNGKLYPEDFTESKSTFNSNASELKIRDGDKFYFFIDTLRNPQEAIVTKGSQNKNFYTIFYEGKKWVDNKGKDEYPSTEVAKILFQHAATYIGNISNQQSATPTIDLRKQLGGYILYENIVVKVGAMSPDNNLLSFYIKLVTSNKLENKVIGVNDDEFDKNAQLFTLKDGDIFTVFYDGNQPPKEVVVKIDSTTKQIFFLEKNTNDVDLIVDDNQDRAKGILWQYGAEYLGNINISSTAPNISNLQDSLNQINLSREPDDYVYSKKAGYIYGVYVDKTRSGDVELLSYEDGVESRNLISSSLLNEHYLILQFYDGLKFKIPNGGSFNSGVAPTILVYEKRKTGQHILSYMNGWRSKSFGFIKDVKFYLLSSGAKVILDGVEENDELKDPTAVELVTSDYDQMIEQLTKDIAQLMFFKSVLSPIDFEKKIELSQEISKKQLELNQINFYLLEKKTQSDSIFDELFEQSFNPIKSAYAGVYSKSADETDFFTPDGKKSQLSDSLNLMIRTPQFKAWFGDWELAYLYKDTDAVEIDCSKVLTENFEPMLVWHGTGQEFSYFKFDTFPAAYFAVRPEYSQFFAELHGGDSGFVIPFFLNIRNPLDLTHFKIDDVPVKDFFDYIFLQTGLDMDDLEVNPIFMDSTLKPLQTWIFIRNNPNMLKKIAALNIFDGIRFYETNPNIKDKSSPAFQTEAFITFNSNQSKIADPERGAILLGSMKSFILEKGGAI
jgi:hypothetical protein